MSSPAVRAALARQTQSLGQDTAAGLRRRAVRVDDAAERAPRRWFRKPSRADAPAQAGIGTRGIALAIDALIAQLIFLTIAATFGLIGSLVGGPDSDSLVGALAGVGWAIVVATYFLTFWTGAGQTPGMRLMGLRLLDASGLAARLLALARARCSASASPSRSPSSASSRCSSTTGAARCRTSSPARPWSTTSSRRCRRTTPSPASPRLAPGLRVRGIDPRLLERARPARLLIRIDAAIGVAMALLVIAQAVLLAHVVARGVRRRVARATSRRRSCCSRRGRRARARARVELRGRGPARRGGRALAAAARPRSSSGCAPQPAALDGAESAEVATAAVGGVDALETLFARYLPQLVLATRRAGRGADHGRDDRPDRGAA